MMFRVASPPEFVRDAMNTRLSWKFVVSATLAIGVLVVWWLTRDGRSSSLTEPVAATQSEDSPGSRVILSKESGASAGVQTVAVARRMLQSTLTVPGRIAYNGAHRVEVKSSVDVVIREVLVKPGDAVQIGTRLAVLDSPEIGLVRAEVERNKAELRIANQAAEWVEQMSTNLADLLSALQKHPQVKTVEEDFDGRPLGDHRQQIVSAYSRYVLADELWEDVQPLVAKGSVSSQVAKQRDADRQVAKESFLSVCEQSQFEARQARDKARSNRDYARRLVAVSHQRLRSLLGAFVEIDDRQEDDSPEGEELTRFYLVAPFEGTVEQRLVSEAQRLAAGTPAFVVADTRTLWVAAEIRERDWQALSVGAADVLRVRVPAVGGDRKLEALVDYVGREVNHDTRAVPLIAEIDNRQHLLKPGMFAWITIPASASTMALCVPTSALQSHDGRSFVFVQESPLTFVRVDVTLGMRTRDWIEIEKGLTAGQQVVASGSFLLKSELLLKQGED
ncbi:MAG: efflux RND transporter periplasmic adaptor subunit [Planctomycetales bacterium]